MKLLNIKSLIFNKSHIIKNYYKNDLIETQLHAQLDA